MFEDGRNEEANSRNLTSSISNRDSSKQSVAKFKSQPFVKNVHMNYYKAMNQKQKSLGSNFPNNPMVL